MPNCSPTTSCRTSLYRDGRITQSLGHLPFEGRLLARIAPEILLAVVGSPLGDFERDVARSSTHGICDAKANCGNQQKAEKPSLVSLDQLQRLLTPEPHEGRDNGKMQGPSDHSRNDEGQ